MGYLDVLREDCHTLLRCPGCAKPDLTLDTEASLRCEACGSRYPVDAEHALCALLASDLDTPIKGEIRRWWNDLYRQLYAAGDARLDGRSLPAKLDALEDLLRRRKHLAVTEMPLGELSGKTVLEIGSGAGAASALFQRYGASVVAIDITPERVMSTARKLSLNRNGNGRAYQADAEHLPFGDGSFDFVYSNGVLHHSENTSRCLDEVFRVLRPGGTAVVMLYSRHSATFWLNIVPRALVTGEIFRWPEAQWIGRLTEGRPKFGTTRNPITRVYSKRELIALFDRFRIRSLRKSSFQFDNLCVPRLTQIRAAVLKTLGRKPHPGGELIYGAPFVAETEIERALGGCLGFAWNILAEKPAGP